MKYIVISILFLIGCVQQHECKPENLRQGHAILVGYKVAKSSHVYFKLLETGTYHNIGAMGGRREPSISIGDTVIVSYCIDSLDVHLNTQGYPFAKEPLDRTSRRVGYTW